MNLSKSTTWNNHLRSYYIHHLESVNNIRNVCCESHNLEAKRKEKTLLFFDYHYFSKENQTMRCVHHTPIYFEWKNNKITICICICIVYFILYIHNPHDKEKYEAIPKQQWIQLKFVPTILKASKSKYFK